VDPQVAHQIAQVCGQILVAHLVEVRAPLFIGHDHKAQHFFSGQLSSVLRLFWFASVYSVSVLEIPLSGGKKTMTECLIVEVQRDRSPLDLWCHVTGSPFA
jgi:hypothetical protein